MDWNKKLREIKGLRSWTQFAKDMNVTPQTLQNYRNGATEPGFQVLVRMGLVDDETDASTETLAGPSNRIGNSDNA